MNVWIVVPAYNEGKVIGDVIRGLRQTYPNVVVIDDASRDNTVEMARNAGAIVLEHLINRGQGAALKTGIVFAIRQGAECIVTFDSDGQHHVEDISKLLQPIAAGTHDVALGSRFLEDGSNVPPLRRLILRAGVMFTRIVSRINVTDTHNGLRAFSRMAAEKIRIQHDRMAHASEILDEIVRNRLRYTEVPVTITYSYYSRGKGQSSMAMFKIALKFLFSKLTQ